MEYTNEFLARVYGAYIGCKVLMDWKGEPKEFKATYAVDKLFSTMLPDGVSFSELCKLLLTSLSEISDEDAVQVECGYMKNLYSKSFEVMKITRELTGVNIEYRYKDSIEELNNDDGYSYSASKFYFGDRTGHISKFDYLRARGYDCGFGEIPSLIEAGIAIKKQQP